MREQGAAACADMRDDLSALLDGELSPERAAELRSHLEDCPDCRAQLARLQDVDARLAASARGIAVPSDLRARLAARIAGEAAAAESAAPRRGPAGRVPRLARRGVGLAAAAAAAAGLALVLARPGSEIAPPPPPEPALAEREPAPPAPEAALAGRTPAPPAPEPAPTPAAAEPALAGADLAGSDEDLALLLELETVEDLDVIANLDLLEQLVELGEGTG